MAEVTLSYGDYDIASIPPPNLGYQTTFEMPLDFVDAEGSLLPAPYDWGGGFDKVACECEWELSYADAVTLLAACNYTDVVSGSRGEDLTMTLTTGSGFFPFSPAKGDAGIFTVSLQLLEQSAPLEEPRDFYYFKVLIVNTGAYPAYTPPDPVPEGIVDNSIASIQNLRFPPDRYHPEVGYAFDIQITEGSVSKAVDKTSSSDRYMTSFRMVSNQANTAWILYNLIDVVRGTTFTLGVGDASGPFGIDQGVSSNSYSVRLTSGKIQIKHEGYNRFSYSLKICLA